MTDILSARIYDLQMVLYMQVAKVKWDEFINETLIFAEAGMMDYATKSVLIMSHNLNNTFPVIESDKFVYTTPN